MSQKVLHHIYFNRKAIRFVNHLVFWTIAYLFFIVFFGRASQNYKTTIIFISMLFPVAIGAAYLLIYYLIPAYYLKGKMFLFFLFSGYLFIITGWLAELICLFTFIQISNYQVKTMIQASFDVLSLIVGLYFVILMAVVVSQVRKAIRMQNENTLLEKKHLEVELKLREAELSLLKAQIHPHFLFNTLNNLYGLTLEKSAKAPDLVLRISDLLDYVLYQCNQPMVALRDELNQLQNYIEIERIRYGERLLVEMKQSGDSDNLQIAPMLLLPFLENAFKHGVSKQISNPFIRININIQNYWLNFLIENSCNGGLGKEEDYSKGIGLKNVRKRLEMLYPGKYRLSISREETIFRVDFTILLETERNTDE
jgi:LytS/YehU family sensor histidine kinase